MGRVWLGSGADALGPRMRLAALAALLGAVLVASRGFGSTRSAEPQGALAAALSREGLELDAARVVWLAAEASWLGTRPALFLASRPGELSDVWYGDVRVATDGRRADAFWLTNVTRSSSAAETSLVRVGRHVAFAVRVGEAHESVVLLDVGGEPAAVTAGWPMHARWQNAVTNLQETGRWQGFGRRLYLFDPPVDDLELGVRDGRLVLDADETEVVVDPARLDPIAGAERVRVHEREKGQPGLITWAVDTVRNVPWIGREPIEWLEHTVFGATDRALRAYHKVAGPSADDVEPAALAAAKTSAPEAVARRADAPEVGLPPPPLTPVLAEPVRDEGKWLPVSDPVFVNAYPNAPTPFWQTFLRVDPERTFAPVYVTLWDPRQVQLHVVMGTREPESATGETGSGLIPGDADVLEDLVGAFNGGFQALHGEFGMMADGRVYLPPKPYAATVGVYGDGRVEMGTWPGPKRRLWDEQVANQQIPADMISMRQNLTSVVEDGVYNPWKRWWWGAAPLAAEEQTYIGRSGLCLTTRGHMAFLWGESMGPDELGKAMLALDCARGIHLDMNTKHTGFELYRPYRTDAPPRPLDRERSDAEFEGEVRDFPGWAFRARLAVDTMAPIRFPRYLNRDPRDFFFLTLKRVLPGPDLDVEGKAVAYSTEGLPQAGWPPAFARATLPDGTTLVRIDARRAVPPPLAAEGLDRALAYLPGVETRPAAEGELSLHAQQRNGRTRFAVGPAPRRATVIASGAPFDAASEASAALGVDAEGFVLYVEAPDAAALRRALALAGAAHALALGKEARLAFVRGETRVALDGQPVQEVESAKSLAWIAETRPAAAVMNADLAPKPYRYWGWLQDQRVRYFPTGPPRFPAPEDVK